MQKANGQPGSLLQPVGTDKAMGACGCSKASRAMDGPR